MREELRVDYMQGMPATIRSIILHIPPLLPENTKIKIYKIIILPFVIYLWSFAFENNISWECSRVGFRRIYLALRGSRWQESEEHFIVRNFTSPLLTKYYFGDQIEDEMG
jgi:hypothetical protein